MFQKYIWEQQTSVIPGNLNMSDVVCLFTFQKDIPETEKKSFSNIEIHFKEMLHLLPHSRALLLMIKIQRR